MQMFIVVRGYDVIIILIEVDKNLTLLNPGKRYCGVVYHYK